MKRSEAVALVDFNPWANRRVLAKVARLPLRALSRPASLSYPTPIATLVHRLDAQWYWREGAQFGMLPREVLRPSAFSTLRSLRQRWDEEDRLVLAFVRSRTDRQLAAAATYVWPRARPRQKTALAYPRARCQSCDSAQE